MAQKSYDQPPERIISPDKNYYATFRTEKGPIRIKRVSSTGRPFTAL
jgi:hypothetical protein